MRLWWGVTAGLALSLMLWIGSALAQGKPSCDVQGRMKTPERVEGQVLNVDNAQGKVTVRGADGTVHELQASAETLKDLKVGDKLEAKLREAPKCP